MLCLVSHLALSVIACLVSFKTGCFSWLCFDKLHYFRDTKYDVINSMVRAEVFSVKQSPFMSTVYINAVKTVHINGDCLQKCI